MNPSDTDLSETATEAGSEAPPKSRSGAGHRARPLRKCRRPRWPAISSHPRPSSCLHRRVNGPKHPWSKPRRLRRMWGLRCRQRTALRPTAKLPPARPMQASTAKTARPPAAVAAATAAAGVAGATGPAKVPKAKARRARGPLSRERLHRWPRKCSRRCCRANSTPAPNPKPPRTLQGTTWMPRPRPKLSNRLRPAPTFRQTPRQPRPRKPTPRPSACWPPRPTRPSCTRCWPRPAWVRAATWSR